MQFMLLTDAYELGAINLFIILVKAFLSHLAVFND